MVQFDLKVGNLESEELVTNTPPMALAKKPIEQRNLIIKKLAAKAPIKPTTKKPRK